MVAGILDHLRSIFSRIVTWDNLPIFFILTGSIALPLTVYLYEALSDAWFRFVLYFPYALAVLTLFGGNIILCKRSVDGTVSVWLATVTYAVSFFALLMVGICALVVFTWILPETENSELLKAISSGLVGVAAAGDSLAAIVFVIGLKKHALGHHIDPRFWRLARRGER